MKWPIKNCILQQDGEALNHMKPALAQYKVCILFIWCIKVYVCRDNYKNSAHERRGASSLFSQSIVIISKHIICISHIIHFVALLHGQRFYIKFNTRPSRFHIYNSVAIFCLLSLYTKRHYLICRCSFTRDYSLI